MKADEITLLIFTCEGREHLLQQCYQSFSKACDFNFKKVILAIDGKVDPSVISMISPDLIIQSYVRKGYVNNIVQAIALVDTDYFFWLEDDWYFHNAIDLKFLADQLTINSHWAEIVYNKDYPSDASLKRELLAPDLFRTSFGFSANPCVCKTVFIRDGLNNLLKAPKGDKLGEDGFENSLTKYFEQNRLTCVIFDPPSVKIISHEGYLESTPRNWHMTNSLEQKTAKHLLVIPKPALWRRLLMIAKLTAVFFRLSLKQLFNDETYEFCFRIISSVKSMHKRD